MSDTLTVRKTPSEEEDARRRREGDGERGEKSVGAFSEADADGEREVIRPCRGRESKSTERDMAEETEGGREEQERKGRRTEGPFARSPLSRDVTEADRKKRGVCSFVTLSHVDAENLISIIVTVTVAARAAAVSFCRKMSQYCRRCGNVAYVSPDSCKSDPASTIQVPPSPALQRNAIDTTSGMPDILGCDKRFGWDHWDPRPLKT